MPTLGCDFEPRLPWATRTDDAAVEALLSIALASPDDVWTRRAVLSATPDTTGKLLLVALRSPRIQQLTFDAPAIQLVSELATQVGSRRDAGEINAVLAIVVQPASSTRPMAAGESALYGISRGLERRGSSLAAFLDGKPGDASLKDKLQTGL